MSIRARLTLWHTALLGAVLLVLAILVYVVVSDQMKHRFDDNLREQADIVGPAIGHGRPKDVRAGPRACENDVANPVTTLDIGGESLFAVVYDQCGNLEASSSNLARRLPIPPDRLAGVLSGQSVSFTMTVLDRPVRVFGTPFGPGQRSPAVFVAAPMRPLLIDLRQLRLALLAIVAATLGLTAAVGWFLASKAMQPVDSMTREAQRIGEAADFARRIPEPQRRDEIGRLAGTFNEMLGRLGQAFTMQRQFLADASHELRTPLTAIRANVDILLRGADDDPGQRREMLRSIAQESDRMGRLVDDLLALARTDAGQEPIHERLSFDALLLDVYHQQRRLAEDVRLTIAAFEPVELEGDPDRLKQLLLNLIDNARRHTEPGGSVTLDLRRQGTEAVLEVRDTGSGIAAVHLPHIFERFYRADSSRSRDGGGAGLGLAISREIVEAHGGTIAVQSRVGAGSTFTVTLPLPPETAQPRPEPVGQPRILTSS
jgi:heavy metal sensor kinase